MDLAACCRLDRSVDQFVTDARREIRLHGR
jgi:hypothetical protein